MGEAALLIPPFRRVGANGITQRQAAFVDTKGIAAPAVSAAGEGRIYFDFGTNKYRISENGAAYSDLGGDGNAFVQGGNSFGAVATIGTNDGFAFEIETSGFVRMSFGVSGLIDVNGTGTVGAPLIRFTASSLNPGFYIASNTLRIAAFNRDNITIGGNFVTIQPTSSGARLQILDTKSRLVWNSGTAVSQHGVEFDFLGFVTTTETTEFHDFHIINTRTLNYNGVPPATHRFVRIGQPSLSSTAAQTIALAATVSIDGAPIAVGNMTITKSLVVDLNGDARVTGELEVVGELRVTGQSLGPAGTSFNPTWSHFVDPNTGTLRSGPDRWAAATAGILRLEINAAGDAQFTQDVEIDGDLNHDGSNVGFYGTAPVAQHSSTGEATGFTAGAGTGVNDDSTFTGNVGATAYRISDVVKALKNLGLMAA